MSKIYYRYFFPICSLQSREGLDEAWRKEGGLRLKFLTESDINQRVTFKVFGMSQESPILIPHKIHPGECAWSDDDDELFLWYGWPTKGVAFFPAGSFVTITNLRHAASRIWTCPKSELRLWWMKLCSSDDHYITAPTL